MRNKSLKSNSALPLTVYRERMRDLGSIYIYILANIMKSARLFFFKKKNQITNHMPKE
jgi:hypothetical protein